MDQHDDDDGRDSPFVLPPLPLATGLRLPAPDGRQVHGVRLVVTTADGAQTEIPLHQEHGAWWAPRS